MAAKAIFCTSSQSPNPQGDTVRTRCYLGRHWGVSQQTNLPIWENQFIGAAGDLAMLLSRGLIFPLECKQTSPGREGGFYCPGLCLQKGQFPRSFALQTSSYRQSNKCGNALANSLPTQIGLGQKVSAAPRKPFTRNKMCKSPACLPDQPTSGCPGFQASLGEKLNLKPQGTINWKPNRPSRKENFSNTKSRGQNSGKSDNRFKWYLGENRF